MVDSTQTADGAPDSLAEPVRVMVVDDSAVIRGLITRLLERDKRISVIVSAGDGQRAIDQLGRNDVEIIVLDVEMPRMDGLSAIPRLLEVAPNVRIIMASTLTQRNAEISLQAMQAGAVDYVPKPTSTREVSGGEEFRRDLTEKVITHAKALRRQHLPQREGDLRRCRPQAAPRAPAGPQSLRPVPRLRPAAIAIGSSTGGPQALFKVIGALKGIGQPIFVTQHMPPTFTRILSEHIERSCGLPCAEAEDGQPVTGGCVYLAPGDRHMIVEGAKAAPRIRLDDGPQENFCRPAVDPMLRSLIAVYGGSGILAAILTGMGQDGLKGCQALVDAGGAVFVQDEATSVVWGMPGAVHKAGLSSAIEPLERIGPRLRETAGYGPAAKPAA